MRGRIDIKQIIYTHLNSKKIATLEKIRSYPPPIPACDAQFNYLLAKRDGLSVELRRLKQTHDDDIGAFIAQSNYLDDDLKNRIQTLPEHNLL